MYMYVVNRLMRYLISVRISVSRIWSSIAD